MAELVILDVGHGNCAVIHEDGSAIVVDAAPSQALPALLDNLEIEEISCLLISHADADHVSGAISLLADERRPVRRVFVNPDARKTACWRDFRVAVGDTVRRSGTRVVPTLCRSYPNDVAIGDVKVEVLFPTEGFALTTADGTTVGGIKLNPNTMSGVIKVSIGEEAVCLLAGDMTRDSLDEIVSEDIDISAPLLVFPHHGGLPGKADVAGFVGDIMGRVEPSMVYFSHGRNKFSNPRKEVVDHVSASKKRPFIACSQLSRTCGVENPNNVKGRVFECSEGFLSGSSCMGTVRLKLAPSCVDEFIDKSGSLHSSFVKSTYGSPMCKGCDLLPG